MGTENQEIGWTLTAIDRASSVFKTVETGMGRLETVWGGIQRLFAVAIVSDGLAKIVAHTQEAEQASNRLTSVLRNTGAAAGFTRDELDGMAGALAESTQFDDKSIKKAEAEILVFGKIHGDTFKEALKLSADVAAFWGTDLPGAAKNVAKALAEPETAFKLLKSAGVTLTEQQKDQIKHMGAMGDVAGQQRVILDSLKKAYSGVADEMNSGFTRATTGASKAWDELLISLGKTAAVRGTTQSGLGFVEQSLKDIKQIIENGDWVEKLLGVAAFAGGMRGLKLTSQPTGSNRPGEVSGKIGGLPELPPAISDADYAAAKISRLTAFGLSEINLGVVHDAMARELKILDDFHQDGLVSEAAYYADRHSMIESRLIAELTAVQKGEAAQRDMLDKANTPQERAAAGLALIKLDAARDKAIRTANTDEQLVTSQQRRAAAALQVELGKFEIENILAVDQALEAQRDIRLKASEADKDVLSDMQFEIDLIGKTAIEQQKMNEARSIDLKLRSDLRAAAALDPTGETKAYQATVVAFEKAAAAQKAAVLDSVTSRIKLERDWDTGAKSAFQDYIDHATNAAEQAKNLFTNAFKSMEDALTNFVMTGKLDFKSLANSIIANLVRIQIKSLMAKGLESAAGAGGLLGSIAGLFGGGSGASAAMYAGAGGADWMVGGSGGTGSKIAQFKVTPGERVIVQTPGQQSGRGDVKWTIVNTGTPQRVVGTQRISDAERILITADATEQAVAATAAQFSDPNSKTSRAMSRNFSVQRMR